MKARQHQPAGELRINGNAFDKIMRRALQVHPESATKAKKQTKAKVPRKKSRTAQ